MEKELKVQVGTKKVEFIDKWQNLLIIGEYPKGVGEFTAKDLNEEQKRGDIEIVKVEN